MSNGDTGAPLSITDWLTSVVNATPPPPDKPGGISASQLAEQVVLNSIPGYGALVGLLSLLRLITTPPDPPARNETALTAPVNEARFAFQGVYWTLIDFGMWHALAYILAAIAGTVVLIGGEIGGITLYLYKTLVPVVVEAGLEYIDAFRKDIDPAVASVSVEVLNELLGTDFTNVQLAQGNDIASHLARAQEVGALFHQQMISQLANANAITAADGVVGAERFTGQIINFGTATALLGLAGELGTGGLIKNFRLVGEQVSSGLGLSRLHRISMTPLLHTLVAVPYQWYLNKRFHPTQFHVGELINPFTSALMDQKTLFDAMDTDGYSADKVAQLIKLHQKRLTLEDVEILARWGYWAPDVVHTYLVNLGWPEDLADTAGRIPELRRIDSRVSALVVFYEGQVDKGHMSVDDAVTVLRTLPITPDELAIIQATMAAKVAVPKVKMSVGELEQAFEQGIIDLDQLVGKLTTMGWMGDELQWLTELILLKFAKDTERAAIRKYAYDRKVEAAAKKGLPKPPAPIGL